MPACLKPTELTSSTIAVLAKIVQKAARKPSINTSLLPALVECSLTDAAMVAVIARPTELPNCATALKTLPARDCSSVGKASDMTRLQTLKRTIMCQPKMR